MTRDNVQAEDQRILLTAVGVACAVSATVGAGIAWAVTRWSR